MGKIDLLQGNLEMMILRVLAAVRSMAGDFQRIHVLSHEALKIEEVHSTLALPMERKVGSPRVGQSENNRGRSSMN